MDGVEDQAGNAVPWPITWSFAVADYGASSASVRLSGLLLNTTYVAFQAKSGELAKIQQDIATFLSIPLARITNVQAAAALGGNLTAVSFVINAPGAGDTKTAVAAAQALAKEWAKTSPVLSGSLTSAVTSKVVCDRRGFLSTHSFLSLCETLQLRMAVTSPAIASHAANQPSQSGAPMGVRAAVHQGL